LKDLTGDGVADEKDITLTESATNLQVNLSLEAKPSALNNVTSDDFSLGTSWLGVKGAAEIGTKFGATLNLGFGFDNTNGFYIDTSGTKDKSEFIVNLDAKIPTLNLEGNLGPFQAMISNQTGLAAGFIKTGLALDLKAKAVPLTADRLYTKEFTDLTVKDNLKAEFSGSAGLNLRAESKTINALPSITAEMDIQWDDFIKKPNPTGKFKNVILDSGTFVKTFNPIFKTLKEINDPVRPIVDLLKTKLPLVKESILDLSDRLDSLSVPGQKATNQSFIKQFVNTSDLIQKSDSFGGPITLIGEEGVAIAASSFAPKPLVPVSIDPLAADVPILTSAAPAIPLGGKEVLDQLGLYDDVKGLAAQLSDPANQDFQMPLFTDPLTTIPKLLTGQTTDLFTLNLPTFQTGFEAHAFIPVLGPIGVQLDGQLGAALNLKFGYDSSGWNDFSKSGYIDGEKFANGLYIESFKPDVDKYGVFPLGVNQDPKDDPKYDKFIAGVGGKIYGGIGVGFALGSVSVGGGINASLKLVPKDPSGKIRINDLANPGCVLLPHGKVDAYLGGKVKLGFGPFSVSKTLVLARANLLDYTAECASGSRTNLGQAKKAVDGNLELQTTNANDVFLVRHVPATAPGTVSIAGNEILEVDNSATLPIYSGIKSITNTNLTDGDDIIILDPGVLTAAVLRGGKGFDQLDGGAGNDQLYGDDGEDVLSGNAGNDSLYGGAGDDALTGGAGNDLLDGEAGQNFATYAADPKRIVALSTGVATASVKDGYGGTDRLFNIQQLEGSNFGDYITLNGSNQNLVVFGLDGNDNIFTGSGNDFLLGGEGADTMNGGAGEDATSYTDSWANVNVNLATTYANGGTASGDRLFNMEDVQGSIFDDILVGNSSANKLDGGLGADTIEGGAGADTLTGGENGNGGTSRADLVTYKHSSNGVNVNITAGASNTGGDAEGDVLFAAAYSYTDQQGKSKMTIADVFYNLEGSKFVNPLTGFGDTLTGNEFNNIIYGLAGNDILNGGEGYDTLVGGAGADRFDGGSETDWVDYSISDSGSETFITDIDNNALPTTGVTVDLIGTGRGGDAEGDTFEKAANINGNLVATVENIRGSDFGDKLSGDAGDNIIAPGLGIDVVDGREDLSNGFLIIPRDDRDILQVDYGIRDIGTGINALGNAPSSTTPGSVITRWDNNGNILDQVTYQNIESLQLTGTIQNDKVGGTDGNDIIDVQDGNDLVYGYRGNDTLNGGDGKDILDGGTDNDSLLAGTGDDIVFGGNTDLSRGIEFPIPGGNDTLYGEAGNDLLIGGDYNDTIFGGDGKDLLIGSSDNDNLSGGAGDDVLVGGDSLAARTLYYGPQSQQTTLAAVSVFNPTNYAYDPYAFGGRDTLTGGAGADQFWLDFKVEANGFYGEFTTIADYTPTEGDKIVVPVLDRTTIGDGVNYFPDSKLGLTQYGGADSPFFLKQVGADVQIFLATLKAPANPVVPNNPPATPIIINSVSLVDNSGTDPKTAIFPSANLIGIGGGVLELNPILIDPIIFQPVINATTNQIALVQNTTLDKIVLTLPSQLAPPATPASITPLAAAVETSSAMPLSTSTVESIATLDNSTVPLVTAAPAFTIAQTSDATALLNKFLSPDALAVLKNVKVKVIGDSRAFGTFANDPFGLNDGLVLSTGRVKDLPGVNQKSGRYKDVELFNNVTEFSDLNTYLGASSSTPDKIALEIEFDSTETDKNLFFQYVFGSEELTEWGGTQFNDIFSLQLNGQSLAKLSDGNKAVNIRNLANRADGPYHPDLIVNSAGTGPAKDITKLDGYTKPETFVGKILNGRNRLVIKLQDLADGLVDSAVFLKANSLSTILPPANLPLGGADAVIVTPAQIEVTEGDAITNSFEVKLQGAIAAPVTITITPDPQVFIGNTTDPMTGAIITPTESKPITLTFTPSNSGTAQSIFVQAVDDTVIQGKRTVPITLTTSSTDTRFDKLVITPEQVVINDNEKYTVGITTSQDATEGSIDGNFTITLDAPAPVGGLTVNYNLAGVATTPADYNLTAGTNISAMSATSFTIALGQTTATLKVVAINDNLIEPTQDVQLQLQAGSEYILGSANTKSLNILDNSTKASVAPAGTDKTVTIDEDTAYTFTVADFGFTDPGDTPPNTFVSVKITTLPTAGTLKVGGVVVTAGDSINVVNIPQLTFSPIDNANGAGYANLTFQVQDNGDTIAGGTFTDLSPNTLTFNVNPINDPALISGISTAAVTKNLNLTIPLLNATGKLTVTDIDPGEAKFRTTVTSVGSNLGTLTIDPTGNYSYNVANNLVQNLLGGQTKVETFTVQSFDGTASQNISVTINGVNDIVVNNAKIQGSVWNDLDGNSSRGGTEPGLADWTVYIDKNGNNQLDLNETTTTTKADGSYEFAGLAPGAYNVNEVLQTNWKQTFPAPTTLSTTAADIALFSPAVTVESPTSPTASSTTNPTDLIQLDRLSQDSRFANIKGQGLTTVFIDTGIDVNHPIFGADKNGDGIADRIVYQYDFADGDTDASDVSGHGSHVASIASQIAPESNIIVLKVFKDSGTGSFADLEKALQWVVTNAKTYNVGTVNLSLGDGGNWNTAQSRYGIGDELAAIASQNIITASATGNDFFKDASVQGNAYPAADPNVIGVGAVWASSTTTPQKFTGGAIDYTAAPDRIASFSQRSATLGNIFAPGIFINGATATGGMSLVSGTSEAVPFVSGVAILAQQIAQSKLGRKLTVGEFRTLLASTSDIIKDGDDESTNVTSTGATFPRLNALALAEGILKLNPAPPASSLDPTNGSSTTAPALTTYAIGRNINLLAGQTATGIDFGNQRIPNRPPALTGSPFVLPGGLEDTAYTFTDTNLLAGYTDPDGNPLTITNLTAANGSIVNNSGTYTFTPTANYNGAVKLTYTVADGNGGVTAATNSFNLAPVNDAPTGQTKAVTLLEDSSYTFTAADFGFSDPVDTPANNFDRVKITTIPAAGTLKLGNTAVIAGDVITVANIPQLTFSPVANANGIGYATLSFQVQDDGGKTNGGVDLDPTSKLLSLNVIPVNDLAVIDGIALASVTEDATNPNLTATGKLNITDIDTGEAKFSTVVSSIATNLGILSIDETGNYNYTVANSAVQSLGQGKTKLETFTVKSLDGSATKDITVTINGVNDIAVISGTATASVTKNTSKTLTVTDKLNIADVDTGEDKFNTTITPVGTTLGNLTINTLGNYSYSVSNSDVQNLGAGQTKIENFSVKSSDGSATKDISITINGAIDPSITVTATNPSATEGGSGGLVTFTRTDGLLTEPLTFNYNISTTGNGRSGYGNTPGTLTFPAGSSTVTLPISVPVSDVYTRVRTVSVLTGNGYLIGTGGDTGATVNVTNTKPAPALTIGDISIVEGNEGKTNAVFTVTLSGKTADPVTVDYTTVDSTAIDSSDYDKIMGKLIFAPEETSKTVTVAINGDTNFEDNETFFVNLSNPTNTTIAKAKGIGTILNDDKPTISLTVTSPHAAETRKYQPDCPGQFTLKRTGSNTNPLTISYDLAGTATEGKDYTCTKSHQVTFAAGSDTVTIDLNIIDDKFYEGTETAILTLASSKDYLIAGDPTGTVTIEDNDSPKPSLHYQSSNNSIDIDGGSPISTLKFTKLAHQAGKRNEVGMFAVDDAAGTIDGIKAGTAGYLQAAMNRALVVCSGLSESQIDRQLDDVVQRHLSVNPGTQYQFYLVDDNTTDRVKADLAAGRTPTSVIFSQPDANPDKSDRSKFTVLADNSGYQIAWDDSTGGDKDFNDLVLKVETLTTAAPLGTQLQGTHQLIDLLNSGSVDLQAIVTGDAAYKNTIGFYTVDALDGRIGEFKPGDNGYAKAALNRSVMNMTKGDASNKKTFAGNSLLAPYLVANGTVQDVLTGTKVGQMPQVYFSYMGANSDGQDHVRLLGDNKFAFEDQLGGGDRDFNDAIVQIKVTPVG
jgi:VCBS repeat-containing protein